jgi:hypothetical protein
MGIAVVLQDERCNDISQTVLDPLGVIALSLPDPADASYTCLRFIDPYGDTVFNPLQAKVLIGEWARLESSFSERKAEELWSDIRKLIVQCSEEPHTYLRFIGD